jgi:hypothetical protein
VLDEINLIDLVPLDYPFLRGVSFERIAPWVSPEEEGFSWALY